MDAIIQPLVNAGAVGIFALYLIWERRGDREERLTRVEADKALAASLAALTEVIRNLSKGGEH